MVGRVQTVERAGRIESIREEADSVSQMPVQPGNDARQAPPPGFRARLLDKALDGLGPIRKRVEEGDLEHLQSGVMDEHALGCDLAA